MTFTGTSLPGVILIEPRVFRDERGFFLETYHAARYSAAGIRDVFVQDNHSRSVEGTLRGLHVQTPRLQGKLIRVIEGEIFDLAVDIRLGSPTFGQWYGTALSAENFRQLYVPPGYAHGFYVLSGPAQVEYKCTDLFDPSGEISIQWNDPEIGIEWPIPPETNPILSAKDSSARPLRELRDRLPVFTP
ncbi:MAG: dTDP-4-dehydrorhamnose 3,5-epimerase [Acidobacteria bacterium]|nr:dTDP-4-dehydrorhamnose 3,5-epimerase [Acidobacteriota bacterium]